MSLKLTNDAIADWAETKPADEEYDYWCEQCALGQYLTAQGIAFEAIGTTRVSFHDRAFSEPLPDGLPGPLAKRPWTFGALAQRLRA